MGSSLTVTEYDPRWIQVFQELRDTVAPLVNDIMITIEHVGSTSVPGLPAKPIIDIDVAVRTDENIQVAIQRLATLGYVDRGDLGVPGREAFIPPEGAPKHHLYVCAKGNDEYLRHILFRDYLRQHPHDAKMYGDLKMNLARQFRNDRAGYMAGKDGCVKEILRRAMEWH